MKNILIRDTTVISFIASLAIFLSYKAPIIQNYISNFGIFGSVVIPSTIFVSLFNFLLWLYRNFLWCFIHRENCYNGLWIYKLYNQKNKQWLYGYFIIKQNWNNTSIPVGQVWYLEDEPIDDNIRGIWSSSHVVISSERMLILFDMLSGTAAYQKSEVGESYKGIIEMSIEGKPPSKLCGRFRDLDERFEHSGMIVCKKVPNNLKIGEYLHQAKGEL